MKVVISGGYYNGIISEYEYLNSVEAYDHHEDKWTFLPDMLFERCGHAAVSMSNKIFIVGGFNEGPFKGHYKEPCEVYDKVSNNFSCIESPGKNLIYEVNQTYSVGNSIVLITGWYVNSMTYCVYDVDKTIWSAPEKHLF